MTRLGHTSDETQRWVKGRRKMWWQTTGIAILAGIATIIGFRDQIADQLDWIVVAIHGPTKLIQDEQELISITNTLQRIEWRQKSEDNHLARIDSVLHIQEQTNQYSMFQ